MFDRFRLDPDKLMLYHDNVELSLPPKVIRTLVVLIESTGAILSKDELIEKVWGDAIVEESNLSQNLYVLRKTLGTRPQGGPYIETLRRRGYRFVGNVRIVEDPVEGNGSNPRLRYSSVDVERHGNVLRLIDRHSAPVESPNEQAVENASDPIVWRNTRLLFFVALILVLGLGVTGYEIYRRADRAVVQGPGDLTVLHLTNGEYPSGATISNDGNYFAFCVEDGDLYRLFVQQVGQSTKLELASFTDKVIHTTTFSPDGRNIYFLATERKTTVTSLYRIPTIRGSVSKILDNVNGPISFSPDGNEMVFIRYSNTRNESRIVISDKDGKNERVVSTSFEHDLFGASPAWSPDGKFVAVARFKNSGGQGTIRIQRIALSDGSVSEISNENWDTVYRMNWLTDGSGLVFVGTRGHESTTTGRDQIYIVTIPDGRSRRLTTDGNRHEVNSLGVTNAGAILAVSGNRSSQLWWMNANGDQSTAVQITKGSADGRAGLCSISDGRILYVSRTGEDMNIWIANADGSNADQIVTGYPGLEELRAELDGKYLVFSRIIDGQNRLVRVSTDGSELKQITFGEGREIDSSISPDGEFIVYDSPRLRNGVFASYLFRIGSNGEKAEQLGSVECSQPTYSPDGTKISCIGAGNEGIILSADSGSEIRRFSLPPNTTSNFGTGWLADSSAITLIVNEKSASNIWIFPLEKGEPSKLTNFTSGVIYRYVFSSDGSRLYLSRGYPTQDALLITNYR